MPVQLNLIDDEEECVARPSVWSQLPEHARQELARLFAEALVKSARSSAHCHEEANDESLEDTSGASAS